MNNPVFDKCNDCEHADSCQLLDTHDPFFVAMCNPQPQSTTELLKTLPVLI